MKRKTTIIVAGAICICSLIAGVVTLQCKVTKSGEIKKTDNLKINRIVNEQDGTDITTVTSNPDEPDFSKYEMSAKGENSGN